MMVTSNQERTTTQNHLDDTIHTMLLNLPLYESFRLIGTTYVKIYAVLFGFNQWQFLTLSSQLFHMTIYS